MKRIIKHEVKEVKDCCDVCKGVIVKYATGEWTGLVLKDRAIHTSCFDQVVEEWKKNHV